MALLLLLENRTLKLAASGSLLVSRRIVFNETASRTLEAVSLLHERSLNLPTLSSHPFPVS
jgi:hypothetical protein